MRPLSKFRPNGVSVTDLCSQIWCEKQLEFSFTKKRIVTKEMKIGKSRHISLHQELVEIIEIEPKTRVDYLAVKLINCQDAIKSFLTDYIAREIPVWGKLRSLFIVGSIDELKIRGNQTCLIDTKTRHSESIPSEEQKITNRLQVLLYTLLLKKLKNSMFTPRNLLKFYKIRPESDISKYFKKQIISTGKQIDNNILNITRNTFDLIKRIPPISKALTIRYDYKGTGKILAKEIVVYNEKKLIITLSDLEKYWHGKRIARKVPESEKFKCRFCQYEKDCK
ncbi:hypothetical protein GF327_02100 [Candidatus Woesearchaeota archaeon]|nr:hypothetical protein [Candidatus Woesearchaeota archaeon]